LPGSAWLTPQSMRSSRLARLPIAVGRLTHRGLGKRRLDLMFEPLRRSAGVRRDAVRMFRSLDAADTQAAAAALGTVTIPVLIAWSADDGIFPPEHASRLAALLPHATVSPIADSLAFSPIDQPATLAERIAGFSSQAAS
ncbi:MAG TPA: alpha/beta hydrolase, partial [Acidimicrobiales bacterium]